MPLSKTGTMGGANLSQLPGRATGDAYQEAETIMTGDGTISNAASAAFPISQGTYTLTKGSAAAIILGAPNLLQSGTVINITAGSAFAHVVTATGLVQDGVTGGGKGTLTFAAFVGSSISLVASQQKWNVLAKNLVTIT